MSRYTADSRDRVFDAVDMVQLVSARTELSRKGVDSYFGLCPFHDERTESFHVRPERKHYHCFGCQASGDPFDFVMETEGLDFKGAIETLADRFGVGRYHNRSAIGLDRASPDMHDHGLAGDLDEWLAGQSSCFQACRDYDQAVGHE